MANAKLSRRQKIIVQNGVKNLIEFGYPDVDKDSIFTDEIYSEFFIGMINENLENGTDEEMVADLEYLKELVYEAR